MLAAQAAATLPGRGSRPPSGRCPGGCSSQGDPPHAVLGSAPRVAVEAAVEFGWSKWLGRDGAFIGMHGFGASAPAQDLYKHFGITAEAVAAAAREVIDKTKSRGRNGQ